MSVDIAPWLAKSKWPTVQIRRVAKLGTGHTPSRQVSEYWVDCVIPWITLADVWQLRDGTKDLITDTHERVSYLGLSNSSAVKHPKEQSFCPERPLWDFPQSWDPIWLPAKILPPGRAILRCFRSTSCMRSERWLRISDEWLLDRRIRLSICRISNSFESLFRRLRNSGASLIFSMSRLAVSTDLSR